MDEQENLIDKKPNRKKLFVMLLIVVLLVTVPVIYSVVTTIIKASVEPSNSFITAFDEYKNDGNKYHIINTYNSLFEDYTLNVDSDNELLCYNKLDDNEKLLYRSYDYAVNNFDYFVVDTTLYLDKSGSKTNDEIAELLTNSIDKVELAYYYDNPEKYWQLGKTDFTDLDEGTHFWCLDFDYCFSQKELGYSEDELKVFLEDKEKFDNKLNDITKKLKKKTDGKDDWHKALITYKWVCDNLKYDKKLIGDDDDYLLEKGIYGAVMDGKCVCRGYAEIMNILLKAQGINNTCIPGMLDENVADKASNASTDKLDDLENADHLWNLVAIDSGYYNIDATQGDSDNGKDLEYDMNYFCTDDKSISKTHKRCNAFNLPTCDDNSMSFFVHEKLYKTSLDSKDVDYAISYALKNGYNVAGIKYKNAKQADAAYDKFVENSLTVQNLLLKYNNKYDSKINIDTISEYYTFIDTDNAVFYIILNYKG